MLRWRSIWRTRRKQQAGNHRNGASRKTVDTGSERIVLDIPRDRQGRFDPVLIGKYQRRFPGFDEKIIAMYARGLSTRDIQAHIEEACVAACGLLLLPDGRRINAGGDQFTRRAAPGAGGLQLHVRVDAQGDRVPVAVQPVVEAPPLPARAALV